MGNSPPPPPPPPPTVPIEDRKYNNGLTCPEYTARVFAISEDINYWGCGRDNGCPGWLTNGVCNCACSTDISAARTSREAAEKAIVDAAAKAAREKAEREAAERARLAREAAERERIAAEAAAKAERERLAREAAERERLAREAAERERQRLIAEAAARVKAKTDAKTAWDAAEVAANIARVLWEKQKTEYATATNAVPPLKLVYDNAQMAMNNATAKKAAYDDAIAQQTSANTLFTAATEGLSKANTKLKDNLDKTFAENTAFLKNAAVFQNTTFGIEKEYTAMSTDWTAFSAAKTALAAMDPKKVSDVTTATDKLVETYNNFMVTKGAYDAVVIKVMKANSATGNVAEPYVDASNINAIISSETDSKYVKKSKNEADVYGLIDEFKTMADAWAKVTKSVDAADANGIIVNYTAYVPTRTAFTNSLLIAQNKRAEADFQTKLAGGKDAAAKWLKSSAKGCRNVQTTASTDQNMLDQDIACNDTEYISGYTKVSGFDAAPVDPNITRDNIVQYLAVKYSCCTAPEGGKGPKGKRGLPGLDGAPGLIGPAGPDGADGPPGPRGEQGDMGEEGGKGPRGDAGDNGKEGEAGPPGKPGKSVVVPFIRQVPGPIGLQGKMGPQGKKGPKGPTGMITPAPSYGFSELDRTIALLNLQEKINNYLKG